MRLRRSTTVTPALTLDVNPNATTGKSSAQIGLLPTISHPGQRAPLFVARDELFYWTKAWQQGERESLAELDAGNGILFDSDDPEDIVRWLHEPDGSDTD